MHTEVVEHVVIRRTQILLTHPGQCLEQVPFVVCHGPRICGWIAGRNVNNGSIADWERHVDAQAQWPEPGAPRPVEPAGRQRPTHVD
jgi:hypothetical protein